MGLLINIPMVDWSFLQTGIDCSTSCEHLPFLSQVVLDLKLPAAVVLHSTDELCAMCGRSWVHRFFVCFCFLLKRLCSCSASSVSLLICVKTRLTCKVCLGNQPPNDAVILCLPIIRLKPIAIRESNAGFYKNILYLLTIWINLKIIGPSKSKYI